MELTVSLRLQLEEWNKPKNPHIVISDIKGRDREGFGYAFYDSSPDGNPKWKKYIFTKSTTIRSEIPGKYLTEKIIGSVSFENGLQINPNEGSRSGGIFFAYNALRRVADLRDVWAAMI